MPVPKKRMSKRRTRMRRANHMRLNAPNVSYCSKCSEPKLPHRVCPNCGHYNGREVIQIPEE